MKSAARKKAYFIYLILLTSRAKANLYLIILSDIWAETAVAAVGPKPKEKERRGEIVLHAKSGQFQAVTRKGKLE